MLEFVDILLQKRRFLIATAFIVADLLLISLLAPVLQRYQASVAAHSHNSTSQGSQDTYSNGGPNAVTNALSSLTANTGRAAHAVAVRTLSGAATAATAIVRFEKGTAQVSHSVLASTFHGIGVGAIFTVHAIGGGFAFAGHTLGSVFGFAGHGVGAVFGSVGHGAGDVFGFFGGVTHIHVSSVIRAPDNTPTPTITQLRIQQAALIQSGTKDVSVAAMTSGMGGACDSGNGNGGYPLIWCNAPMDSIATVSYSSDRINRECTSYAYWYFTAVEGHADFQVRGNAKYWASTSSYPTHSTPAVGAIAVETAGAYGHVAIVQALPGQTYAGQKLPDGYVLVSEMNYDWNGHFRYSLSPLSKFSSYIYP